MKILIIDNHVDPPYWGAKELCRMSKLVENGTTYVRRGPQQDLPKSPAPYDRIIVSGSATSAMANAPWIDQLLDFIRKAVDLRKHYLGVCYGHELLARALGGPEAVAKASIPEWGWTEIETTQSNPLFEGLPNTFYTFSSHEEEVVEVPLGIKRFARSKSCQIQAIQFESLPIFGVQFHPEKNLDEAKRRLKEKKLEDPSLNFLEADRSDELYNPEIGKTLFKNFLSF